MLSRTLIFVSLASVSLAAHAATVTISPSKDNTLYEATIDPTSNGAGVYLFVGNTIRGAGERRALLAFDIAAAIPAGSTIQSASLRLTLSRNNGDTSIGTLSRALANWGEAASDAGDPGGQGTTPLPGDATWLHRFFPTTLWSTPGGDFAPSPSGTTTLPSAPTLGQVTWPSSSGLVADVQHWLDAPASNFGWIVAAASTSDIGARRFFSRNTTTPSLRPTLTIEFTPPCPCAADFDNSGGTPDAGDIDAFFIAWLAGDAPADVDCSGGTPDASDIDTFFEDWLAGGC
jgi:hypothetical protein